jgi:hypothetical protein
VGCVFLGNLGRIVWVLRSVDVDIVVSTSGGGPVAIESGFGGMAAWSCSVEVRFGRW